MSDCQFRQQWMAYKTMVLPKGVGANQEKETRRAFYAGAAMALEGLIGLLSPGNDATPEDVARFAAMREEIHDELRSMLEPSEYEA